MAELRPFRGIRFDPSVVGDIGKVLCPPYDVMSPAAADEFRRRHPFNSVYLELPEGHAGDTVFSNRYTRAGEEFGHLRDDGVLVRDEQPAIYVLEETFSHAGVSYTRRGITTAVRLEEIGGGAVVPHEMTRPGPKADRLALMQAARANMSPVLALYRDPTGEVAEAVEEATRAAPDIEATADEMPTYRMWKIADETVAGRIVKAFSPLKLFVADGHHRYETALWYLNELERAEGPLPSDAAARFIMMTLVDLDDPGLKLLPHHRLLVGLTAQEHSSLAMGLEEAFHVESADIPRGEPAATADAIVRHLAEEPPGRVAIGAVGLEGGRSHILRLRADRFPEIGASPVERCDAWTLVHKGIVPALGPAAENDKRDFEHDAARAVARVEAGNADVAFILRPTSLSLFEEVVRAGELFPPVTTYFYPKLPTGLVFNSLVGDV